MFRRAIVNFLALFLVASQLLAAPDVDVYILTGQSNSLGPTSNEADYSPGTHPADNLTNFFWANAVAYGGPYPQSLYGTSGGVFQKLQMQQGDGSTNPYWWGPEFGFARTLFDAGRTNFVIIKASNAGGGNTLWDKATYDASNSAPMWPLLSNTVYTALGQLTASGRPFKVRGFLYVQGEANSFSEATNTSLRFGLLYSNLLTAINTNFPGTATDMRALIGEIGASQLNPSTQTTTVQQVTFAYSNPQAAFVYTRDQPTKDGLHFGKAAKLEVGMRLANCFLGRPTIVSVGFNAVTNTPDATAITFEKYVPDTNGATDGVNLNNTGPFTGFADGTNGQPPAGLLVTGSAGRIVFADYSSNNITSDIACGQYDFAGHGYPADWTDSGASVSFTFADPTNQTSTALVSDAAFELVSNKTNNVTVSIYDGRGDPLYNSGVITNNRYGFEARDAFTKLKAPALARITVKGPNNVLWTIGHITDNNVPDFAWNGWRIPSPYERWSFQIPDPSQRGDTADADNDGVANLVEYAMATNPTNNQSNARLQALWTNNTFVIQFPRAQVDDITWNIERTTALTPNTTWEILATKQGAQPWTGPATIQETDNNGPKLVTETDPDTSATAHYVRLRITRP